MRAAAAGLVLLLGLPACEAVPALAFAELDATATDAADVVAIDAADAAEEGPTADVAPDAVLPRDGGDAGAGCPRAPPAGASVCCGAVACDLNCVPALCTMCEQSCPGQLCCARNNNVMCLPIGSTCH
jgi:hypothetical protein